MFRNWTKKSRLLYHFYTKMPCRLIIRSWNNTRNFIQSACSAIKYSKHNSLEVQQCYCLVFSSLLILNILKPLPGLRMLYLCDAILSLKFWSQLICAYIWKLNITGLTVQLSHICERKCSPTQEWLVRALLPFIYGIMLDDGDSNRSNILAVGY